MKVLMLNYEYPPIGGGTGNANRYLLRELREKDVEVDLVTSSPEEYREEHLSDDVTVYRLDVDKEKLNYWRIAELLRYMVKGTVKAWRLDKENDYDLVHAWTGFPCGVMAKLVGEKYIVALRGSDVPGYSSRFSGMYFLLKPLIRQVWSSADEVIPNSSDLRDLAQETLDMEMEVIPNGVDAEEFLPGCVSDEDFRVLTVARLIPRKRVRDVVRAVENLDVELEVVGDGPEMEKLKELVSDFGIAHRVSFTGEVDHGEIHRSYRRADVFVLPSLNEGMSNTVLEAMASGLPVITTDTGGTEELIEGNGVVVGKRNPGGIRKALVKYMDNPERVEEHGDRSRSLAEERSWEKIAERYVEVYNKIAI